MTMEWYDYVRIGTSILSLCAMYYLGRSWVRKSSTFTNRLKDFWWATNAMLFAFFIGNIEQVLRNREETWSLFIGFFAAMVTLKAARSKNQELLKSES